MSWKPEVMVRGEAGKWHHNALVFATKAEAENSARDLAMRWTLVTDHRAVESDKPVNYTYHDGRLVSVKEDSHAT